MGKGKMSWWFRKACLALCCGILAVGLAIAQDEPEIEIRYGEDKTFYEYRVNGEIVEIKVVPKSGQVYYLVVTDSGDFERSATSRIRFPSWKLMEW